MENNIYEAPKAELTPENDQVTEELASRWQRLFAVLIDTLIAVLIQTPIFMMIFGMAAATGDEQLNMVETIISSLISMVIFIVIHGHFLAKYSQTIGKRLLKIKIVTLDGQRALVRPTLSLRIGFVFVLSLIPLVGPIILIASSLFIFGKERRCGHDYFAKTKVVKCVNQ